MLELTFIHVGLLILSYILGALPIGIWVSQYFDLDDPRTYGSKNVGATNILRAGHKLAAFTTFFFDMVKGSVAVVFALLLDPHIAQYAGLMAVIGHVWPIFQVFKGGKGVSTTFGVFLILSWPLALMCAVTWIVVVMTSRYSSFASLLAIGLSPLYTAVISGEGFIITCFLLTLLILWTHRANIGRLLTGREPHIGEADTHNIGNE